VTLCSGLATSPILAAMPNIRQVTVRDASFVHIKTISSGLDVEAFAKHWASRERDARTPLNLEYKVDIQYEGRNERWLYDPGGLTQVLTKGQAPVYRLTSPPAFNFLLGIGA
jgi:hypothetical protein